MRSVKAGIQYYHTPSGQGMSDPTVQLDAETLAKVGKVLANIPQGMYILTTKAENEMQGMLVSWVQQISFEPPMVMIGIRKGRDIVPLIHGGHCFALSQIGEENNLLLRKFGKSTVKNESLEATGIITKKTGAPILKNAMNYLDCELIRHMDVEGDHDIYVGLVLDGDTLNKKDNPLIHLRKDGLKY